MREFVPLLRSAHLETVLAHFWPRSLDQVRYPVERRYCRTEPEVQVLVESQRPTSPASAEIVLVHGLEGSGEAGYMRSLSQAALEAGMAVHRFHLRTCGGTEALSKTLYHSGLTCDLLFVLRQLAAEGRGPLFATGFSLGGNVVLKLAGELGDAGPALLRGVCAVSPPIDLSAASERLGRWDNGIYERRFVRKMRQRLCATGRFTPADFAGIRTIRQVDERITAPSFGFRDAAEYYRTQSAARYLDRIRIPALVVQAKNDPLVPFASFEHPAFRTNRYLRLIATERGGHVAFLARRKPHLWLDGAILQWIAEQAARRS
jgi:predicted alpha/beta-fold hydrolase